MTELFFVKYNFLSFFVKKAAILQMSNDYGDKHYVGFTHGLGGSARRLHQISLCKDI